MARLAPALGRTTRFINPSIAYRDGCLSAYNSVCYARLRIDLDLPDFHCDPRRLRAVIKKKSRVTVDPERITIQNGDATFHLARLPDDQVFELPAVEGDPIPITDELARSAKAVAAFVSWNAIHPWARCVHASPSGLIATNNITLACARHDPGFELAMPLAVVGELAPGRTMVVDATRIAVREGDDLTLSYHRLWSEEATKATTKLLTRAAGPLAPCAVPLGDLKSIMIRMECIDATALAFEPGLIRVEAEDGAEGTHEFDCDFTFRTSIEGARLLACFATHVDASQAPDKLMFSRDGDVPMVGALAGMRLPLTSLGWWQRP
jgi:hypothetical protein